MHDNILILKEADCKGHLQQQRTNKWKPRDFQDRIRVVQKVEAFHRKVELGQIFDKSK